MTSTAEYEKAKQTPQTGDKINVSIERAGVTVLAVTDGYVHYKTQAGDLRRTRLADPGVSVEIVAPPTPAWWPPQAGDVIRVSMTTYLVTPKGARYADNAEKATFGGEDYSTFEGWLHKWGSGKFFKDVTSWHRVTLLVRHGKAYPAAQS